MLFARPLTENVVVVIPLSSTTVVAKPGLVETCSPYDVAPAEAFQLNTVGLVDTPISPSAGDRSVGEAGSAGGAVVKLLTFE